MFLSVIIPTRNRARHLEGVLSSLRGQTHGAESFEVLVVDNGSTDNTRDVCETFRAFLPNFQYLYDSHPGLHVGRHLGMKRAQADILVYADDDIEAFPTWLEGIAEAFEDDDLALAGGKNLPKFESAPPDWIQRLWKADHKGRRVLGYLSIFDFGDSIKEVNPLFIFGCNFSIRKKIILEAGGFHPDSMPIELIRYRGDGETHISRFIRTRGYKSIYHPKASLYHLVPMERMKVDYFSRRAFFQGISDSYTSIRNRRGRLSTYALELKILIQVLFSGKPDSTFVMSYLRGFLYHQREVKNDPALQMWVMKDTYLD